MNLSEKFLKKIVTKFGVEVAEEVFKELALNTQKSNFKYDFDKNELEFPSTDMFDLFTSVDNFVDLADLIIEKTCGFNDDKTFIKAENHLLVNTIAYVCYCGVESADVMDEVIEELEFSLDEDFVGNLVELGDRYKSLFDSPYNHFQDFVGIEELIIMYKHSFETLAELYENRNEIIESCVARLCYFTELDVSVKIMVVE